MKIRYILLSLFLLLMAYGCASLMPSTTTKTNSSWQDYNGMKQVFDTIEPYKTTLTDFKEMAIDPYTTPNTRILNALTVKDMFTSNKLVSASSLPDGIQDCLKKENFDRCIGFEFAYNNTRDKGIGSLMLRMLSFKKENHITGHDVKFYVFLKYDETLKDYLVVYKLEPEGDTAGKDQTRVETKPLGPLQEPFEIFKGRMAPN